MIFPAIDFIRQKVNAASPDWTVDIGNISEIINNPGNTQHADVIISLINVEEDRISRDPRNYIKNEGGVILKNPAIHLNLTLLFTSVRNAGAYGFSLQDIQNIIGFFQKQFVFDSVSETALANAGIERLILDILNLNLQQLHEIWSVLGGKYFPSVAYRMRMVIIDSLSKDTGTLITDIKTDYLLK